MATLSNARLSAVKGDAGSTPYSPGNQQPSHYFRMRCYGKLLCLGATAACSAGGTNEPPRDVRSI